VNAAIPLPPDRRAGFDHARVLPILCKPWESKEGREYEREEMLDANEPEIPATTNRQWEF
jgi:hypothetical protein